MQENHLFEYAVIRVVPRVEREEFLNTGIILYCKDKKFLEATIELNRERLNAIGGYAAVQELEDHLLGFQKICRGEVSAGPIAKLDAASRFRWLTAARSTVVQTSKVHAGFSKDPLETLKRLHRELVQY
ncbi:DUF3037 family protein [Anseongella ginsenosidimutans]|uniref:DUF3037 family protein n=1 Tax=Anseongella ginsenosidimutans TaxID=496056 RepID=A0A4R3KUE6_9SPHI|nr:DUF3037 domain-containing protein [Anseongella ginsenosidimutans]QEC53019.1 DUF3037 domain-containing protein [Anseongella ginsenosidimutans]TCS87425.1 DUF3037 family protein [Anseongella ginsenosidimutans]